MDLLEDLQYRAYLWHCKRFPEAKMEHVTLKLSEETGEVAKAVNGISGFNSTTGSGDVGEESADVLICVFVLLSRWFPEVDLLRELNNKLTILETPGQHRASTIHEEG